MMKNPARYFIRRLTATAILTAVSIVLMYLEIGLPIVPSFLKFDFSDFPALIISFACGPVWGVASCLIKNIAHIPMSFTGGVGELANFLVGATFALVAGLIYSGHKTKIRAITAGLIAAAAMAAVSFPVNLFISYPVYFNIMDRNAVIGMYTTLLPFADTLPKALLIFNLPFTLVKGLISVLITYFIYKPVSVLIKSTK